MILFSKKVFKLLKRCPKPTKVVRKICFESQVNTKKKTSLKV